MLCQEFRKPGGGKGRPGRNMKCTSCGITWELHGTSSMSTPSIAKRKTKLEIDELQGSTEIAVEISEPVTREIIIPEVVTAEEFNRPPEKVIHFKFGSKIDPLVDIASEIFR